MTERTDTDWNPGAYHRFRGYRLQPALDLLGRVGGLPEGDVIDLGCGAGNVARALRARFADHGLVGVDTSDTMLAEARALNLYDRLEHQEIADWTAQAPVALTFANAALHWVGDHPALLPRLAGMLAPGGMLAVQMPHQNNAPSHRVWRSLADEMFPGRVDPDTGPSVLRPVDYHRLLSPLGHLELWETEYYQILPANMQSHPVRCYTETTFARPILAALDSDEQARLIAAYEGVMDKPYPRGSDGTVLFPFKRLFFTLTV
ncbi:methyltransferase domain-containing protein [Lacimonas salitolerans]|uniref:Methyltransferase domain-containing protein n=1 Tax=Lacimonas salitolerans TaxID=1323750 RepID=A0ABW4EBN7_9RHOB